MTRCYEKHLPTWSCFFFAASVLLVVTNFVTVVTAEERSEDEGDNDNEYEYDYEDEYEDGYHSGGWSDSLYQYLDDLGVVDWEYQQWTGLTRLLGVFAIISLALHALVYTEWRVLSLLFEYSGFGARVSGDVLSCELGPRRSARDKWDVNILYEMPCCKYEKKSRMHFRHPETVVYKSFLKKIEMDRSIARGKSAVEMLVLVGLPKSGMPKEIIERDIEAFSRLRALCITVPGVVLMSAIMYFEIQEVLSIDENQRTAGWIVFGVCTWLILFLSMAWSKVIINGKTWRMKNDATVMVRSDKQQGQQADETNKSDPLLGHDHSTAAMQYQNKEHDPKIIQGAWA
eukprot:CAMPEP_0194316958 /NCGR_PEP_ID=MMETSP0171-20130528/13700_1 /TAXON_ID=218684 /ORGANISM="Corethron pennatum, Strain L29A3" /LENGTH=342 /DNA_ID=CAMNT_0039073377 /DNA_START=147 /DNA_END=1175 /DNA_ORIENTATION=-